ncbi:DedA family protein [Anaeromyxobacter paludicola]|uniref:VTT domain-containing protein n=1 Tax=Anaeromyxobacter paludicola TaxID=2918171 RepID=A0ABN6N5N3_9BACT|nr:DedA family protein [Anaeromyxobacter paludicola]BDG07267.1 hypothetical protein AMPC_03800 [Anaeromyxobacter paludicola]
MLEHFVDMLRGQSLEASAGFVFGMLLLCGFGLPLPEDVVLVTGGVLAWLASSLEESTLRGMISDPSLLTMVAVGLAGIVAGDSVIYWMGRRLGSRVAEIPGLRRLVTPEKLEQVEKLMRRRGKVVVVIARYLPGLRAPTYFTVGHSRVPYLQFVFFDAVAALVSAPLFVGLGFYFGDDIELAARAASRFSHYILIAVALVLAVAAFRWMRRRAARAETAGPAEPPMGGR